MPALIGLYKCRLVKAHMQHASRAEACLGLDKQSGSIMAAIKILTSVERPNDKKTMLFCCLQKKLCMHVTSALSLALTVVGTVSAASPAPSTFCLLFCPSARAFGLPLPAGLLTAFLTAEARTGSRCVSLFSLKPSDRISRLRWIANMGIRMIGFSILTCRNMSKKFSFLS